MAFADDLLQICYRGKSVFSSSDSVGTAIQLCAFFCNKLPHSKTTNDLIMTAGCRGFAMDPDVPAQLVRLNQD